MSTESAIAYVSVVPQAKGAGRAIERQINPQALGASVGSKMSPGFLKSVGSMAVKSTAIIGGGVAAIGATIAGVAAKKGLSRLLDIDDAKGKLAGLKTSTQGIASIMDSALKSVRGTAFGLGDAAGVASNAVAAGVKQGDELTKYLKLTADAATIAGVSLGEMGSIINKTTTSGKVYTDNLNQLADRGIPIFGWLQKEYGVSAEELSKMVSKGKVDAATFRKVIEENIGGAALASGKTVRGAAANMGAALGRLGAMFLSGGVSAAPTVFTSLTNATDRAGAALQPYADKFNAWLIPALQRFAKWVDTIDFTKVAAGVASFGGKVQAAVGHVRDFFAQVGSGDGSTALGSIGTSLSKLTPAFQSFREQLPQLGDSIGKLAASGITVLAAVLGFLANHVDTLIKYMPLIVAGFVAWRLATVVATSASLALRTAELLALPVQITRNGLRLEAARLEYATARASAASSAATKVNTAVVNQNAGAVSRMTLAQRIQTGAARIGTVATLISAGAMRVFGAAVRFAMGPVGIIIGIVSLLVAGLVWFFTQTKIGKAIVQTVFAAIKVAVAAVGAAFVWLWDNAIKPAWDGIAAGATWLWSTILQPVFAGIGTAVQAVGGWFVDLWTKYIAPPLTAIGNAVGYLWDSWISPIFQLIGAIIVWAARIFGTAVVAITNLIVNSLGVAFNWLWTAVIQPVFGFIGALFVAWWTTVQTIFGWVVSFVVNTLGATFTWLWASVISPVFTWIGAAFSAWWNGIVKPVFGFVVGMVRNTLGPVFSWLYRSVIQPVFSGIGTVVRNVWNSWLKPVFDKIADIAKVTIPNAFSTMKDAIGKAWDAVKTAVKAPIKFVVETVIQKGIIDNFNKLADVFHTDRLPKVELPKGFAGGGYTGPGGKYDPAGIVHAGEFVFTKEQTARLGVGRLYDIARNGYAGGGFVSDAKKNVSAGWDWLAGKASKAWDWTKNAAETAKSIVSDPMGTLGKLVKKLIGTVPGAGAMLDVAKGAGRKVLAGVIDKIKGISDAGDFGGNGDNGQIPSSALAKASGFAPGPGVGAMGGLLKKSAASAWDRAYKASGNALRLTEGYRDLKAQQYRWGLYQKGGNLAARPGTSIHGFGLAADVAGGQAWLRANGAKYGWVNTGLGFSQREPWHFEFKGAKSIPQLAEGAFIRRSYGGSLVNVGEGRYDEAVVPLTPSFKDALESSRQPAQTGPLIGNLTLPSSGNVKNDIDEIEHWLRSRSRGGRPA